MRLESIGVSILENHMEKNMENEMGIMEPFGRGACQDHCFK